MLKGFQAFQVLFVFIELLFNQEVHLRFRLSFAEGELAKTAADTTLHNKITKRYDKTQNKTFQSTKTH